MDGNDKNRATKLLTLAGFLMLLSGVIMMISGRFLTGAILFGGAFAMFVAANNYREK